MKKLHNSHSYLCIAAVYFIMTGFAGCTSEISQPLPEEIASLENLAVFPADLAPLHEITLTKETSYGDVDDVLLGSWLSATVDHHGRVFIADQQNTVIHLYNPDGSYNRQIGREGDGPGEYRGVGVMRSDENYFYHYDRMTGRLNQYDINTFELVDDLVISVERNDDDAFFKSIQSFHLLESNIYLIQFGMGFRADRTDIDMSERKVTARRMNAKTGEYFGEEVFSFPANEALVQFRNDGSMSVMGVPYKRSSAIHVEEDSVIHGWNEHFLINFYDLEGNHQRAIYYQYPNVPLNRNKVLEMYEDRDEPWKSMVQNDNMPETWPAFQTFTVDDEGRIWVKMFTDDYDTSRYVVLANSGELLAEFTWPRTHTIQQIQNGYLYSMEEDEDGLRRVVKYEIAFS
ncbi:MAG: 6-bladed beta-propeller [Balneolaceae bacterium]|nr:MAG: 6-bladed beta-propeller [Balneolaceae bacterium]